MTFPALVLQFRHPGEAVIVLRSLISTYERVRADPDASELSEVSEHLDSRLALLRDCLASAEFDLQSDHAHPPGRA